MGFKLKIGIVLSTPYEGSMGVVVRVADLSKSLLNLGVEVHVLSPFELPSLSNTGVVTHHLDNLASKLGISNNVYCNLQKCLSTPFLARNLILRKKVLSSIITSLSKTVLPIAQKEGFDLLQGEQELSSIACLNIRDKVKIPVVSSLHNIWPEELVASGIIESADSKYSYLMNIEKEIAENSDMVIVLSQSMKDYLHQSISGREKNVVVVPLGSRPRISEVEYAPNPSRVVHAGLLSKLDNVDLFIDSMPYIKSNFPQASFHLTDKGEACSAVKKRARNLNVKPTFFWFPNNPDFFSFLKTCHVGIVTSKDHVTRKFGYTMKFFDYLSLGIPVVANDIGGWTKIIEQENIGLLTSPDATSFGNGVLELLQNPETLYKLGTNCLHLSKTKFNIDFIASSLRAEYTALTGGS
jgi:glycosyltransferase involved in cell wall biosynthesis